MVPRPGTGVRLRYYSLNHKCVNKEKGKLKSIFMYRKISYLFCLWFFDEHIADGANRFLLCSQNVVMRQCLKVLNETMKNLMDIFRKSFQFLEQRSSCFNPIYGVVTLSYTETDRHR